MIQSEWSDTIYHVKAYSKVLAEVFYANNSNAANKLGFTAKTNIELLICMNYTWTFNYSTKNGRSLF